MILKRLSGITTSTTRSVRIADDRFSKIAMVYTGGHVKVRYIGDSVMTDMVQTITLPEHVEKCGDDVIKTAWGYLNHEMGHIEVQRQLQNLKDSKAANPRFAQTLNSRTLFELIPGDLRHAGIEPGSFVVTPTEVLRELHRYSDPIARKHGKGVAETRFMFKGLWNSLEDPRMEAQVSARWRGAAEHLAELNDTTFAKWIAACEGKTLTDFHSFSVAMIFYLSGKKEEIKIFGEDILRSIDEVKDLLDAYLHGWNADCHGFFDGLNLTIAILDRVFALSRGEYAPEPEPEEPDSDGEGEEGSDPGDEPSESEESNTGDSGEPDEDESDEPSDDGEPDGDESGDESGEPDGEDDGGEDGESGDAGGGEPDGEDEGGEGDDEGDGGGNPDDEGSKIKKSDGTEGATKQKLAVGCKVRIKATGKRATITKIYPDGSVEVE